MKRTSLEDASCPIARSLDTIGDWWSLLIVRDAIHGKKRFGEFQKSLGMAKNILATRLRKLVADGILELQPASDGSAYQEYVPTEKGRDLFVILMALRQWGERNLYAPGELDTLYVDAERGKEIPALEVRAKDGRRLGPGDVLLKSLPSRPSRTQRARS